MTLSHLLQGLNKHWRHTHLSCLGPAITNSSFATLVSVPDTAYNISALLPSLSEAAAAADNFLSSDAGEGPFLGFTSPSPYPAPVSFAPMVTGDGIQAVKETPQVSLASATESTNELVDMVVVVEAAVTHAFAACLGSYWPGQAAEREVLGALGPAEDGVALPTGPVLVGPSSHGSLTPVGLVWCAVVPQGWSVLAAEPGDMLLCSSNEGRMVLIPDVAL